AGVLATALGMIDSGTTGMVDISQISHTPEHSDACIRALSESGIRAVFAYSRGSVPGSRYPQDIMRLKPRYFNSQDQLLTLALGAGMPAIQTALDHGVRPSLSSDHAATVAQDFFSVMRAAFNVQRLFVLQRARNGEQNLPPLLACREVLEFATIEGARCANLDGKLGTLTPGKQADIVMLRADRLNVWPLNNATSLAVNLMNPSHVETVFIAGKVRKWRGNLVGVDVPRVLRLVEEARNAVIMRAGFPINVIG